MYHTIQATPTAESKCVHGTWLYIVTPAPNKNSSYLMLGPYAVHMAFIKGLADLTFVLP